jgi:hypothetical protein
VSKYLDSHAEEYLEGGAIHLLQDALFALRASQAENDKWEAAAKATDIYPYLQDALARMGTVGPRGIREMVTYCAGLQAENARLREAAQAVIDADDEWNCRAEDDERCIQAQAALLAALTQGPVT